MVVVPGQVVVTLDTVETLADRLNLLLPETLAGEPMHRDDTEHARRNEAAHAELDGLGLLDRGEPTAAVTESLRVLCAGGTEFYGYVDTPELSYSVHTAASGSDAVLAAATRNNGRVLLRPIRAAALITELLAELPECAPARGRAMSVPERDLRTRHGDGITEASGPRGEARRLLELLGKPRLAAGQLYAGVRDGVTGRRTSREQPLAFLDLAEGRWLSYRTGDDEQHAVATPGSRQVLSDKLTETQQRLPRR